MKVRSNQEVRKNVYGHGDRLRLLGSEVTHFFLAMSLMILY